MKSILVLIFVLGSFNLAQAGYGYDFLSPSTFNPLCNAQSCGYYFWSAQEFSNEPTGLSMGLFPKTILFEAWGPLGADQSFSCETDEGTNVQIDQELGLIKAPLSCRTHFLGSEETVFKAQLTFEVLESSIQNIRIIRDGKKIFEINGLLLPRG